MKMKFSKANESYFIKKVPLGNGTNIKVNKVYLSLGSKGVKQ